MGAFWSYSFFEVRRLRAYVRGPQSGIFEQLALNSEIPLLCVGGDPFAIHDDGFERAVEGAIGPET